VSGGATRWRAAYRALALLLLALLLVAGAAWWWIVTFVDLGEREALRRDDSANERGPEPLPAATTAPVAESHEAASNEAALLAPPDLAPPAHEDDAPHSLSGWVVTAAGERVGADVAVVAVEVSQMGDRALLEALGAGRVQGRRVTTDAAGAFLLPSLPRGSLFRLYCASDRWISLDTPEACTADARDVELTVGALHGVELRMVQHGGAPLPSSAWFGPPLSREKPKIEGARLVDDLQRPLLAGLSNATMRPDRHHRVLLLVSDDVTAKSLGPWVMRIDEAGFEPQRVEAHLFPRIDGEIAVQQVELDPLRDVRFGAVTVRLLGAETLRDPNDDEELVGQLTLHARGSLADGSRWNAAIRADRGSVQRIDGVPQGDYLWHFRPFHGLLEFPLDDGDRDAMELTVAGNDAEIVLDFRRMGAVELTLVGDGIEAGPRRSSVALEMLEPRRSQSYVALVSDVLRVGALTPGRYRATLENSPTLAKRVALWRARRAGELPRDSVEFAITAGATTYCELRVRE
jgi:hypothetical protein